MRSRKLVGLGLIAVGILVSEALLIADLMTRPIAIVTTTIVLSGIVIVIVASRT